MSIDLQSISAIDAAGAAVVIDAGIAKNKSNHTVGAVAFAHEQ